MESILTSVKKQLGITEEYTHFDSDIIMHINTVFMTLTQIGVGPSDGFAIKDASAVWSDFIPEGNLEAVKTYMGIQVRLIFDPPLSSTHLDSMNRIASELEWRLNVNVDTVETDGEEEIQNGE